MMRTSPILRNDALRSCTTLAVRPRCRRMCVMRAGARDSARNKFDAVRERSKVRIAQVTPAVRVAVGEQSSTREPVRRAAVRGVLGGTHGGACAQITAHAFARRRPKNINKCVVMNRDYL